MPETCCPIDGIEDLVVVPGPGGWKGGVRADLCTERGTEGHAHGSGSAWRQCWSSRDPGEPQAAMPVG